MVILVAAFHAKLSISWTRYIFNDSTRYGTINLSTNFLITLLLATILGSCGNCSTLESANELIVGIRTA